MDLLDSITGAFSGNSILSASGDLRPRVLVHHRLGDFVIDPWGAGATDLSSYGITGYEVTFGQPVIPQEQSFNAGLMGIGLGTLVIGGLAVWALTR